MYPTLFSVDFFGLLADPYSLHTYGLFIATGFLLAMFLSKRQALREGQDPEAVVDLAFYLLIAGLIGARLVFILTKLDEFARYPWEIVMLWRGGLVWYGGFIGAALYMAYYCRKYGLPYFKTVDLLIPNMALAHCFGRLGCLTAGCCFGSPTSKSWGLIFPNNSMAHAQQVDSGLIAPLAASLPTHPTQLYEAGGELCLFWLLLSMRLHKRFDGQLFLTWLALYPILRSTIELFRGDQERGVYFFASTSQYISIGVALAAVGVFLYLRRPTNIGAPARA